MGYFHLFRRIALNLLNYNAQRQSNVTNTKINTQSSISCANSFTVTGVTELQERFLLQLHSVYFQLEALTSITYPTLVHFFLFLKRQSFETLPELPLISVPSYFSGAYFFFTITHIVKQFFACCLKLLGFFQVVIQIDFTDSHFTCVFPDV